MTDYRKYINALRKCAKEHENDNTLTGYIVVSDLCHDTANLLESLEQEPCEDCISRKALINAFPISDTYTLDDIIATIRFQQSVTPQSKTGHWEWVQYDENPEIGNFHCSECRYIPAIFNMSAQKLNYCPNCGAKMESGGIICR